MRIGDNQIPEWYELPEIKAAPQIATNRINWLLSELDCIDGAETPKKPKEIKSKKDKTLKINKNG